MHPCLLSTLGRGLLEFNGPRVQNGLKRWQGPKNFCAAGVPSDGSEDPTAAATEELWAGREAEADAGRIQRSREGDGATCVHAPSSSS